jgi:hypothetical protein
MWPKTRRLNTLLTPLCGVIDGETADGRIRGSYCGHAVEAWPHSGYPIKHLSSVSYGTVGPAPVNMLKVVLAGLSGSQAWHCQSSAGSYAQDLTSRFTSGRLLSGFRPGEFKFEGADPLNDAFEGMGEKLVERLGVPIRANADPALQERLIASGLFEELDALRLGSHPYLPKVQFLPSARALAGSYLESSAVARGRPAVEERLRAAGFDDYRSLIEAKLAQAETETPGRIELDVEAGEAKVPTESQFRDVLEHAARIAQINAEVNQPVQLP